MTAFEPSRATMTAGDKLFHPGDTITATANGAEFTGKLGPMGWLPNTFLSPAVLHAHGYKVELVKPNNPPKLPTTPGSYLLTGNPPGMSEQVYTLTTYGQWWFGPKAIYAREMTTLLEVDGAELKRLQPVAQVANDMAVVASRELKHAVGAYVPVGFMEQAVARAVRQIVEKANG